LIATWLAQFGRSMIAAQGILTSLGNLLIIVPFSVSMVASVLIARAGSNGKLQQTLTRRLLGLGGLLTVSFALALKFCETPVLQAMTADPEVLMLLEKSFPYMLVFILVDTFQTILTGVFRGNQRTLQPFLFYSSFFFGLGLPLGFFVFSTFWHPLVGIWLALTVGSLGLGVALWRTHVQVLRYC
ncbi:MAG: MATE family efflux transporter, partial [Bdellovibrionales bacterium]